MAVEEYNVEIRDSSLKMVAVIQGWADVDSEGGDSSRVGVSVQILDINWR